jgi:hypothetical protein
LENLHVPEEEKELDRDEHRAGNEPSALVVVVKDEPYEKTGSNQEQNGADDRIETLQFPHSNIEEVEEEKDNVDDHNDKVESAGIAKTSFAEAAASSVPVGTQQTADDKADDDLEDFDDASVGAEICGVHVGHFKRLLTKVLGAFTKFAQSATCYEAEKYIHAIILSRLR